MNTDKLLKHKDYHTLTLAEIQPDLNRPLEWRRSLNRLTLQVTEFEVEKTFWVNEANTLIGKIRGMGEVPPSDVVEQTVKANENERVCISSTFELADVFDHFYVTVEKQSDEKVFALKKLKGKLHLFLSSGERRAESWGLFSADAYLGHATWVATENDLWVEVCVPDNFLSEALARFEKKNFGILNVNLVLDSFTYEVDDTCRDWEDRREIVLHGTTTPAAVESLVFKEKPSSVDITEEDDRVRLSATSTSVEPVNSSTATSYALDLKLVKSFKIAAWITALSLMIIALKI